MKWVDLVKKAGLLDCGELREALLAVELDISKVPLLQVKAKAWYIASHQQPNSPVLLEECVVLLILQCVQFIQVLVLKSVLMRLVLGFDQSLLDERFGVLWLFRDDAMLAKNVVPVSFQCNQ